MESLSIAPPYSQVMLGDEGKRDAPLPIEAPITPGRYGVVISTLMSQDGTTRFDIGVDEQLPIPPDLSLAFDGEIQTPSRVLALTDPEWTTYWRQDIGRSRARIRVWINHQTEPDRVAIDIKTAKVAT